MKFSWKMYKVLMVSLCIIAVSISVAYGAYWVYSNVVTVNIGSYNLSLSTQTISAGSISLNATLTNNLNPVSGASVAFYETDSLGNISGTVGSSSTDSNGKASIVLIGLTGTHYYKAGYQAP